MLNLTQVWFGVEIFFHYLRLRFGVEGLGVGLSVNSRNAGEQRVSF